jgi:hypothetical protein
VTVFVNVIAVIATPAVIAEDGKTRFETLLRTGGPLVTVIERLAVVEPPVFVAVIV